MPPAPAPGRRPCSTRPRSFRRTQAGCTRQPPSMASPSLRRQDRPLIPGHGRLGRRQVARRRPQQVARLVVAGDQVASPRPRRAGRPWPCRRRAARAAHRGWRAPPPRAAAAPRSGRPTRPAPPRSGQAPPRSRAHWPARRERRQAGQRRVGDVRRQRRQRRDPRGGALPGRHGVLAGGPGGRGRGRERVDPARRLRPHPVKLGDPGASSATCARTRSAAEVSTRPSLHSAKRIGVGRRIALRLQGGLGVPQRRLGLGAEAGRQRPARRQFGLGRVERRRRRPPRPPRRPRSPRSPRRTTGAWPRPRSPG